MTMEMCAAVTIGHKPWDGPYQVWKNLYRVMHSRIKRCRQAMP